MPKVDFDDLALAMEFVSAEPWSNAAYVDRSTGRIYWTGSDVEEEEEPPDDLDDETKYVPVPDKRSLDLGNQLVFDFISMNMPGSYDEVRDMFRRRGAYARFSSFLDRRDMRDAWHQYREEAERRTVLEWCEENGLQVDSE